MKLTRSLTAFLAAQTAANRMTSSNAGPQVAPRALPSDAVDFPQGPGTARSIGSDPPQSRLDRPVSRLRRLVYRPIHELQMRPVRQLERQTTDIRDAARTLRDPSATQRARQAAQATLAEHDYSIDRLPLPGHLWLCPELRGDAEEFSVLLGRPTAGATPLPTVPEPPQSVVGAARGAGPIGSDPFAGPHLSHCIPTEQSPWVLTDLSTGQSVTLTNVEAYVEQVRRNRMHVGVDVSEMGGDPIAASFTFQGSGARGKRYVEAVAELLNLGVIPVDLAGVSSGSLVACMLAAGARTSRLEELYEGSAVAKTQRINPLRGGGGLTSGKALVDGLDREMGQRLGVRGRKVTFGDLPFPLHVTAFAIDDSAPAPDQDMTRASGRLRVFNREQTPRTPVADAVRASVSLPGVFGNVRQVDPMTGRTWELVDGGWSEVVPNRKAGDGLPTVVVTIANEPGTGHPNDERRIRQPEPLPSGRLDFSLPISGYLSGQRLWRLTNPDRERYQRITEPGDGEVVLMLPAWVMTDPDREVSGMDFGFHDDADRALDEQTRHIVRRFAPRYLAALHRGTTAPGVTNFGAVELPGKGTEPAEPLRFSWDQAGKTWHGSYVPGEDEVYVRSSTAAGGPSASATPIKLGRERIEALLIDCDAFGQSAADFTVLGKELEQHMREEQARRHWPWWR